VNAVSDEVKRGASRHLKRRPSVMGEHKDRRVIWRIVTPPAFPTVVWPGASDGAKHIASENISADILKTPRGNVIVDTGLAIFIAVHPLPRTRGKEPVKHSEPANSERILKILIRPSAITID
jgi:hypothetical protein